MLLQNTLLLALIYRYTNTGWVRAAGVLGGSVAAIASVLSGTHALSFALHFSQQLMSTVSVQTCRRESSH